MKKMGIDLCFQKIKIGLGFFHFQLHLLGFKDLTLFSFIAKVGKIGYQQGHTNVKQRSKNIGKHQKAGRHFLIKLAVVY